MTNPFAALLPPDTPDYVALWAETVWWRGVEGSAARTATRLGISERTVRRRCASFRLWMQRTGWGENDFDRGADIPMDKQPPTAV